MSRPRARSSGSPARHPRRRRSGPHGTVGGEDPLLVAFVAQRPVLVGLAYRITGSRVEAEDIVQDAWLRARRTDAATIDKPAAWLTTVVARLALDHLRSARRRRESYVGPWLPEPVVGVAAAPARPDDPAGATELAESVTFGFLRVLETLAPLERVVFLMADVFDIPYAEVGSAVDRSPEACRQIASRARRRIREGVPRRRVPDDAEAVVRQLLEALALGDADRVLSLLAEDAVLVSDGGSRAYAARRPVVGRHRVGRFVLNIARRLRELDIAYEWAVLNGEPGVVVNDATGHVFTLSAHVEDGTVAALYSVVNPDKLAALDIADPMV